MSFHVPTRRELSVHESGHAYAFAALVRHEEPWSLGLGLDEAGNDHGWCTRQTLLLLEVPLVTIPSNVMPHIEWQAAAEIVVALSGPMAEFRNWNRTRTGASLVAHNNADRFLKFGAFDSDGDFQRIRDTLEYIRPLDRDATFRGLIDVSAAIVHANWQSIKRLSRHLLDKGQLSEDDLIEWFQKHPAKPHITGLHISTRRPSDLSAESLPS